MAEVDMDECVEIKIMIIGPNSSGKSSIIRKFCSNDIFTEGYRATIGADVSSKVVLWEDGIGLTLKLWDLGGQDHFANLSRAYYVNSLGCIVVFDSSQIDDLEKAKRWKADLDSKCTLPGGGLLPAVLFANKVDLQKNDWVTEELMEQFSEENTFQGWFETSAKDPEDKGIAKGISFLIAQILRVCPPDSLKSRPSSQVSGTSIVISEADNYEVEKGGCAC